MKSVIVTDTHLGIKNSQKFWLDLVYILFEEICDYCIRNNVKSIIHLGDWFNSRYSINVLAIEQSYKIINLLKEAGIHLYIIKGNHDQYYKNQENPHSLMIFNKFSNVTIVDHPLTIEEVILCPWQTIPEIEGKILMGHYEINGVVTNASGHKMENAKLSIKDFKEYDKVFSGHFHTKSENSNITYIGSAFAMDFNDIGQDRGYYLYDDGDIQEFIEFKQAPKFIKILCSDNFNELNIEGNICKLIFEKSYTEKKSNEIISKIKNYDPLELHLDFSIKMDDNTEDDESFIGTNSEIFHHYIDTIYTVKEGLDKKKLKQFWKRLEEI